ncbi:MAG TPA: protein-glutamate O-methyltransferase CheR [Cyclobacteriaceae bacterium]
MTYTPPVLGKMTDEQFKFLTQYLSSKYGLHISAEKKVLLESRLIGRLYALNLNSIEEYIEYAFKSPHAHEEYPRFVDQITTHKTFFFRENHQFEFLKTLLPDYVAKVGSGRPVTLWSAGCSTGEEVYTLGMLLNESKTEIPYLDYKIVGTDISVPSLKKAAKGLFSTELENIPAHFKIKYFDERVKPTATYLQFNNKEIISKIQLGVLNLNNKVYNLSQTFDFIFCRNVTIYFDAKTRKEVLERIVARLRPGGYLFLGHSETAMGTTLPIKNIRPTIYKKI